MERSRRSRPSQLKFEDCQRSRAVGFVSSDPNFSVRPDGTVYAEQEVANLSDPVQFMVTARGLHDPHIWETTVKLALAGHPHPLPLTKVGIEEMLSRVWDTQPRVIKFPRKHQRGSSANGLRRQKRDWVIPPINVPENSRGPFPHMLVRARREGEEWGIYCNISYNHHEAKRLNILVFSLKHTQQVKSAALVSDLSHDAR
ncbi:cadherin-4-like protein [Lates japonicus]|uniref:Cadherin-4-like protein n=1 Tax=Lates japonicus TaxID=270547 RepID=A0AAD3NFW4_LATJO|nr:cadherin-4-like protein [Lates japonicus]